MIVHPFLFTPHSWQGKGTISFSMADDRLPFTMDYTVLPKENGVIRFSQIVTVEEASESMQNHFFISDISAPHFTIELENQLVGKVKGHGIVDEKMICWEFRNQAEGLDGFEIYELQKNGSYNMRSEFIGGDHFRTFIYATINPL